MSGSGQPATRLSRPIFISLLLLIIALVPMAQAQVTTGTLTGTVTASADGSALPGVTIEAVHVPTGTHYMGISGPNGRYTIPNVRIGGPYRITGSLEGFRPAEVTNVEVRLGVATDIPLGMQLEAMTESIEVTAQRDQIISPDRSGSVSAVSTEQIESLPTVNRSIQDFARTNPYFRTEAFDESSTRLTVAGRNNRYNTIQIDGAVNNDLFGLADTGTPGGQTDTQPISLDAVEQLQMVVSPYDVRQGGFTGGGINAVTRSGSNQIEGSVFGTKRDQSFVGDGPYDSPISDFSQDQYGGRIGGPILQDQLFYFFSGELNRRKQPTGIAADGSAPTQFIYGEDAADLKQYLIDEYGYDPGSLGDVSGKTDSDLVFGRLDWNVNDSHNLTLRHNYVSSSKDVITRGTTFFNFPTANYTITDDTNSTVAQLNSVFGASSFNEARIGLQTIRDERSVPVDFPSVEIGGTGARRGALIVGTERFSAANSLNQDILELTDNYTLLRGSHTITIGTHNEFFKFKNLFMSEANGYYYFNTLDDFKAGQASEYRITFANGSDPRRPTSFQVNQYGLYVSDDWRVNEQLTLTLGLRADMPSFVDTPSANSQVPIELPGYRTDVTPSEDLVWAPRIGFNWNPGTSVRQQVRGGIGVFAGRTPYVWVSNVYGNTGVEQTALSCLASQGCTPPMFNPDPANQPHAGSASSGFSVDLIDPDFQLPRVMRATLGYDRELPWGIRGTAELLYTETLQDVFYTNANRVQTGTNPLDGRPTYSKISNTVFDAPYLTNTTKGHDFMQTLQFVKPFYKGFTVSASYAHESSKSAFDATSSRAISNWQYMPTSGDIFTPELARSNFEVEHRFNIAATYRFETGPVNHTVGVYYNVQSGEPYSILISGDPNGDGYTSNDTLYVPNSASEVNMSDSDYNDLVAFLKSAGVYKPGEILKRNAGTQPWTRQMDFHYELGLPTFGTVDSNITVDVLNFLNLFDKDAGTSQYVSFGTYTPLRYSYSSSTGKVTYSKAFSSALNPGSQYTTSNLRSRWQMRLGLRINF